MVFLKQYGKIVYFYLVAILLTGRGATSELPRQIDITWEVKGVYRDEVLCSLKMHNRTSMYLYVESTTVKKVRGMGEYCYTETRPAWGTISPGYYAEDSFYLSCSPLLDYAETTITSRWEDGKEGAFAGIIGHNRLKIIIRHNYWRSYRRDTPKVDF